MTQTNGITKEIPILEAFLDMIEKIRRDTYKEVRKVPTEYKVHPDDWDELRTQLKPHMVTYQNNDPLRGNEIFGLRIVFDYSVARLRRQ